MENLILQFLLSSSLLVDGSCPGPSSWPSPQRRWGPTRWESSGNQGGSGVGVLLNTAGDPLGGSGVGTRVGVEWGVECGVEWEVEWEFSSTLPAIHWVGVEWEQVATDLLNTRLPLTHSPTPNPEVEEFNREGEKNCRDIWENPSESIHPPRHCQRT